MILAQIICLLISLGVFVWFVPFIKRLFPNIATFSQSVYKLEKKERWKFNAFIFGISLPMLIFAFDPFKWLLFTGIVMLSLVGVFWDYRTKCKGILHVFFATGGMANILIAIFIYYHIWLPQLLLIIVLLIIRKKVKHFGWWTELLGASAIGLGIFISIFKKKK